jgi:hypothetical protein
MTTILDNEVSREVAKIVLKAKYPNLLMVGSDQKLDGLTTAKNIRAELKAAYPTVKFSVKARRFSGGDAIGIARPPGRARIETHPSPLRNTEMAAHGTGQEVWIWAEN